MTTGLVIGAPRSGSGKTTVTLALLAALRRRGVAIRAAKSGPDYIDPAFHAAASGAASLNLDSWAMPPACLDSLAAAATQGADCLLIESSMGLFDGIAAPDGQCGAGADLAQRFALPVLLVLDVSGQSQSAAAIARGFDIHRPGVRVAGVVLNRVASPRHRAGAEAALRDAGFAVLGALPRDANLGLPERHLGLVQASEHAELDAILSRLADAAEVHLQLDAILRIAAPLRVQPDKIAALPPPGSRIALARDAAFSFIYPHLLLAWRQAGAEIVPFSPLADEAPAEDCDCCWLPGGYPELHAARLAEATQFRHGLAQFAATRPVHGECGGYMVLGASLEDGEGTRHQMTGLLSHTTSFRSRRMNLGYRQAILGESGTLGAKGQTVRGHEFHYASVIDPGTDAPFARLADGTGRDLGDSGGRRGLVSGCFFHAIAQASAAASNSKEPV